MPSSPLRPGELLAAAAGVLLLGALLLDWYAAAGGGPLNAWQAFDVLDVVLALLAVASLALAVLEATSASPVKPTGAAVLTTTFAALALLAVLYRWLDQPGPDGAVGVEPGLYVGLLATALLLAGAFRALADESPRRVPMSAAEARPAPPPDVIPAEAVTDAPRPTP
jgi:hypothetical protein